jgi:4,5-DOPA dioxygenase extradiol
MKFPLIFIGHGSPMNAIETNQYTDSWREIGKSIKEVPRAILMLSAHWITEGKTEINTTEKPEMIYDMYGFPPELYRLTYDCPGSKSIAEAIIDVLSPDYSIRENEAHGIDHGAWSTLIHAFPEASIPVIQLSLDYSKSPEWHFDFWKKLSTLREQGILIIASGNIVHNLREIDWSNEVQFSWAKEFDIKVEQAIQNREYRDILDFQNLGKYISTGSSELRSSLAALSTPGCSFWGW